MLNKLLFTASLLVGQVYAKTISGKVSYSEKNPKGVLYVFAKKFDSKMPMPILVKKYINPEFPLTFSLSEENKMVKNRPMKGPFRITARLSPSGSATDKSGAEVSTKKAIYMGDRVSLEL